MAFQSVEKSNLVGAASALVAVVFFSLNDVGIKALSGDYPLHQVVLIRSLLAVLIFLAVIMPLNGGWSVFRTRRMGIHLIRGGCVVLANMSFFLGLAALPIADAVAIFFVSPLVISVFSVIFLGETVGARRWTAIVVGFVGVLVIVKPGTSAFQLASLLPVFAAVMYGALHMFTRWIGSTESAATMTIYIQMVFIVSSLAIGLAVGDGRFDGSGHPSLDFLFRAWVWPDPGDYGLLALLGVANVMAGYFISQAYRVSEAAFAAPFEYVAMPMAVFWGITVFGTWPEATDWLGIALIIGAGLYLLWRESAKGRVVAAKGPKYRR